MKLAWRKMSVPCMAPLVTNLWIRYDQQYNCFDSSSAVGGVIGSGSEEYRIERIHYPEKRWMRFVGTLVHGIPVLQMTTNLLTDHLHPLPPGDISLRFKI
jgi:hypothetical protein